MSVERVVEIEAYGGPFDGSLLPVYAPECVLKVMERSPFGYRYRLVTDCDGTRCWLFAGIIESAVA